MASFASITATFLDVRNASLIADTKIDTELAMKSARSKGLSLLTKLVDFKNTVGISPGFIDNIETQTIIHINDLEESARRCRKLRARERRVWEESHTAKRVTVA